MIFRTKEFFVLFTSMQTNLFVTIESHSSLWRRIKYTTNVSNYPSFSLSVQNIKKQENEKALKVQMSPRPRHVHLINFLLFIIPFESYSRLYISHASSFSHQECID